MKYQYNGQSLFEYCKQNDILIFSVYSRIFKLKDKHPEKNIDEIVEMAINYKKENLKYEYMGMSLQRYCALNDMNYATIISRIRKIIKMEEGISLKGAIEKAMDYEYYSKPGYTYKGKTIKNYCIENDIPKVTIYQRISKIKKAYPEMEIEEVIEKAFEERKDFSSSPLKKYYYNEMSLKEYCLNNNIKYNTICKRIERLKKKCPALNTDELVMIALKKVSAKEVLGKRLKKGEDLVKYVDEDIKKFIDMNVIEYNKMKIDMMIKRKK